MTDAAAAVDAAFRTEWGRVVATLIAGTGDWDLAEECAQDAFAQASARWPREGVPATPGAWLTTVARNRAADVRRRRATEARKLQEVDPPVAAPPPAGPIRDERLELLFTCAHPALPLPSRVALTLRTLTGLTTAEIARAFLVPEATMARRLTRAKAKIRHAGIPFRVPAAEHLPERTAGVLAVVYLLFNEGYGARRDGLAEEAIRLGRLVRDLLPDDAEARGLLALMLLQHARRAARTTAAGDLVRLADQDRARWDAAAIAEGLALLDALPERGPYGLQATIAAEHARARTADATDWRAIAATYAALARVAPSPVVTLNHAVAAGLAGDPGAGLAMLDGLDGRLPGNHLVPAARAELLERAGRPATAAWRAALDLAPAEPERRELRRRLDRALSAASGPA